MTLQWFCVRFWCYQLPINVPWADGFLAKCKNQWINARALTYDTSHDTLLYFSQENIVLSTKVT